MKIRYLVAALLLGLSLATPATARERTHKSVTRAQTYGIEAREILWLGDVEKDRDVGLDDLCERCDLAPNAHPDLEHREAIVGRNAHRHGGNPDAVVEVAGGGVASPQRRE